MEKVDRLLEFLNDRGGFNGWWCDVDEATQNEIKAGLAALIEKFSQGPIG